MKRLARWGDNKYIIYMMHVLCWFLLIIPFLFGPINNLADFESMKYRIIFHNTFLILLFYFNAYYLYPQFYKKKGWLIYLFSVTVSTVTLFYVGAYIQNNWMPLPDFSHMGPPPGMPDFASAGKPGNFHPPGRRNGFIPLPMYLFILGISFSYRLIIDNNKEEKRRKEKETETLKTELDFLRSQISPHFMFNILNTLVSMARKKSDLMEPSLIRLSTLMRYVLDESNHNRIPLAREVEYLNNYIELQSLRFGDDLNLVIEISGNLDDYEIEPMLLIPFVENAFKHGIGSLEDPHLLIRLSIDPSRSLLSFRVENAIAPLHESKDLSSGIGLKNVTRRLELLYTGKYTLYAAVEGDNFIADLQIEMK